MDKRVLFDKVLLSSNATRKKYSINIPKISFLCGASRSNKLELIVLRLKITFFLPAAAEASNFSTSYQMLY